MSNTRKEVKVTNFVNPNLFHLVDMTQKHVIKSLREKEEEYKKYCDIRRGRCSIPLLKPQQVKKRRILIISHHQFYFIPQLLCYYSTIGDKWVRCEFEGSRELETGATAAILWAIDYGIPFATVRSDNLVVLPRENILNESVVFRASLDVRVKFSL
jgi:hypothetical protein